MNPKIIHCWIHFKMPDYSCSKHSHTANPFKEHLISYFFYFNYFQLVVFEVKRIFNDQVTALLTKLESQQSIKQDLSAFIAMMSRVRES